MLKLFSKKKKNKKDKENITKGQKPATRMYMITEDIVEENIDNEDPVSILDALEDKQTGDKHEK